MSHKRIMSAPLDKIASIFLLKTLTLPSFLKVLSFKESQFCVSNVRPERTDKFTSASGRAGI